MVDLLRPTKCPKEPLECEEILGFTDLEPITSMEYQNSSEPLINAVYIESRQEMEIKAHFHNSYEIIYVIEGKLQCLINNKSYIVEGNSLIFINNMETHNLKVLAHPYRRYFILIKPEYFKTVVNEPILSSVFTNRSGNFRHVMELSSGWIDFIHTIISEIYEELDLKKDFWEAAVKSSLFRLFITLYRNYRSFFPLNSLSENANIIIKVQRYIDQHCMEQISLLSVSRLFFMDMYYLSHLFSRITGFTFKEYLILQRVSRAKDLLFHTDENITYVCMNSGFNNVNHFIRIFKKYEGTTPYQYRKLYR